MASWWKKNRPFVAVDFDGRAAHLVLAERVAQQVRILKLAGATLGPDVDLTDSAAVGRALKPALRTLKARKDVSLLMQVSRGQVVLKTIQLPAGAAPAEMPAMVRYQVEKELPFRPEEAVIDFTLESHYDSAAEADGGGLNVLVGAIRVPVADYYRQVAMAAGGKLQRLGLRPYACLRTLRACGLTREHPCAAFVHVGAEEAEIDVLADDALAFSRSAPSKAGATADGYAKVDAVASLVTEVLRSLQSYQAVHGSGKIEAIFVSGGTGLEPTLMQELHARMGLACRVFNPAQGMKLLDDGTVGAFVPALGLALGHPASSGDPLDFTNPKRPAARRDVRKLRRKALVAAAMVLLAVGAGARAWWLGSMEAEAAGLTAQRDRLKSDNKPVVELAAEADWLGHWQKSDKDWLGHLANLSLLAPPAEDVYISNLQTDPKGTIKFSLRAKSDDVVRELDARLTQAGYAFHRGNESTRGDEYGYNFASFATITLQPKVKVDLAATQPTRPGDDASDDPSYKPPKASPQPPRVAPAVAKEPRAGKVVDLSKQSDNSAPGEPRKRPSRNRGSPTEPRGGRP